MSTGSASPLKQAAGVMIRVATAGDSVLLSDLGWSTFRETFVDVGGFELPYSDDDLEAYYSASYAPIVCEYMLKDLSTRTWIATCGERAIGFVTVGVNRLQHRCGAVAGSGHELRRLYVLRAYHGTGVASSLMDLALDYMRQKDATADTFLGVWSENLRAQRFYERYGFTVVGEFDFRVGSTIDREFIMCKPAAVNRAVVEKQ